MCTLVALYRLRQEYRREFQISLGYIKTPKTSLGYIKTPRPAWARYTVSNSNENPSEATLLSV